ncbi:MAG: hypothetical protein Q9213_006541 [Squamulea squamosa]
MMIDFCYTEQYDPEHNVVELYQLYDDNERNIQHLKTHVILHGLGVKYAIPTLIKYAAKSFEKNLLASRYGSSRAPTGLQACVPLLYSSTPPNDRTLRSIVVKEMAVRLISTANCYRGRRGLRKLMRQNEQFCKDMTQGILYKELRGCKFRGPKREDDHEEDDDSYDSDPGFGVFSEDPLIEEKEDDEDQ